MIRKRSCCFALAMLLVLSLAFPLTVVGKEATPVVATPDGVTVVASDLTNPRGFAWAPDGTLFLALAGVGGDIQVSFEGTPAPFFGGKTSSIVTVADGCTTPVAEGLPSGLWLDAGWIWGIMDLVFLGEDLYVLSGGGSESWGQPESPNGVYHVLDDGSWELVADLGLWIQENPPEFIPPDYDPNGSWFDLESDGEKLWVTEAVGGQLLTVTPDGQVARMADLSDGHMVPTGIALDGEGGAYVGFETVVPYPDGGSKIVHVAADGAVTDHWTGLTAVTDVVMGPDGVLYAAEMATNNLDEEPFLSPGTGRIVRQTGPDSLEPVVTDIDYPVMMGFDAAGALYVTYPAFAPDNGVGQGALLSIDLMVGAPISLAGLSGLEPTCATGSMPVATPTS